jgi:hypothetical protein
MHDAKLPFTGIAIVRRSLNGFDLMRRRLGRCRAANAGDRRRSRGSGEPGRAHDIDVIFRDALAVGMPSGLAIAKARCPAIADDRFCCGLDQFYCRTLYVDSPSISRRCLLLVSRATRWYYRGGTVG